MLFKPHNRTDILFPGIGQLNILVTPPWPMLPMWKVRKRYPPTSQAVGFLCAQSTGI